MIRSILLFLILVSCSSRKESFIGDKSIKRKDAPTFLLSAIPDKARDQEFFRKSSKDTITYEAKYELNDEEISVTYSQNGEFLEREIDKEFSQLSPHLQNKIKEYLSKRFKRYRIHEVELRTNKALEDFIDVEVIHHERPTGYSEISFTASGDYVSEEIENLPEIETLL